MDSLIDSSLVGVNDASLTYHCKLNVSSQSFFCSVLKHCDLPQFVSTMCRDLEVIGWGPFGSKQCRLINQEVILGETLCED